MEKEIAQRGSGQCACRWGHVAAVGLPFALFLAHAAIFGNWIVDDAGIAFAYARNLASGNGLVSQPGAMPVEGFSDPLWIFTLTPTFWFGAFHPVWTPKIISAVCVLVTMVLLQVILWRMTAKKLPGAIAATLLAMNSGFVIWTVSGLENALYALLAVGLLFVLVAKVRGLPVWAGVIAAGLALTRPEGLCYLFVYPVCLVFSCWQGQCSIRQGFRRLAFYGLVFAGIFGAYLTFRLGYFGALAPNTFFAPMKGRGMFSPRSLSEKLLLAPNVVAKISTLFCSAFGRLGTLVAVVMGIMTTLWFARRAVHDRIFALLICLVAAVGSYTLLPEDWMGEYRFATTFYPFIFSFAVVILWAYASKSWWRVVVVMVVVLVGLVGAGRSARARSLAFRRKPTVPMAVVTRRVQTVEQWAEELGIHRGSVLCADGGGTLYYSKLAMVDLGGLVDRTIARTLWWDPEAFREYVFETRRPTVIQTHGYWAYLAQLDRDPRFRRSYATVLEFSDPWVARQYNETVFSGVYVRRDAIADPATLVRLRRRLSNLSHEEVAYRLGLSDKAVGVPQFDELPSPASASGSGDRAGAPVGNGPTTNPKTPLLPAP